MAFLWGTGLPGPRWQRRGPFQAWRAACKVALLYLYDGPSATYSRLIQISCLLFLEKMCCVLPVGADTADESPPASLTASNQSKGPSTMCPAWKPLLLIVPLRLGINQINPVYIEAFKVSLFFSQTHCCLPITLPCQHRDPWAAVHKWVENLAFSFPLGVF